MAKKITDKTDYSYSKIRWKDKDYQELHKAYNVFTKEVAKHYKDIPQKALPKVPSYQEVKDSITSRKDLELALSTMKSIKRKDSFELISSEVNPSVKFTKWELQKARRYDYRNQYKLQVAYNKAIKEEVKGAKVETDIYGNPILNSEGKAIARSHLPSNQRKKLESYLEESNVEMLLKAEDYYRKNELLERIYKRGSDTFELEKDRTYKENYLKMFEGYENLDNYEEVIEKLKSVDEKEFFEFIKQNDPEGFTNFQDHYDNRMVQAEFNKFAKRIGVDVDTTYEPVTENIF